MRNLLLLLLLLVSLHAMAGDRATVHKIVDGDTIYVEQNGRIVKVRLIGIDAPESTGNSKAQRDSDRTGDDIGVIVSQGMRSKRFLKSLVKKGDRVTLEYDVERRDRYGRTLAYVYLEDGTMLNELIIASGYASPMTIPPNVKYRERFLKAYGNARVKGLGLWQE